eukprot:TRINITY_DN5691_c0_g2_i1.p1 TRINITY_DN5691_c0_g2~~TRINITY_DN5691_c0_g2_i1.p1  ORF type:complete len:312 (-),score=40.20 TRINITY_DN5691_c0_g2_i1:88-1023(-)
MTRPHMAVVFILFLFVALAASAKVSDFMNDSLLPGPCQQHDASLMAKTASGQKILFVFVAYLPEKRDCDLLQKTTRNVAVFHPHDSKIVVVDNGGPISAGQCVDGNDVTVMQGPKAREMGAWILVQQHVDEWKPTHVTILQHSIIVTSRFDFQAMACPVVSLSHWPRLDKASLASLASEGTVGLGSTPRMEWTSEVASCMNIHCAAPCAQSGPVIQQPLLQWGIAFDSASVWSIDVWKSLTDLGLWKCMKLDRLYGKSESQQFERLVGILMAKAGYPVDRCHANLGTFVQKTHDHAVFLPCANGAWLPFGA